MKRMDVLFDGQCAFCRRCAAWLQGQKQFVELSCIARQSITAQVRYANLLSTAGKDDLLVVADSGAVYRGESAYLMCLWALKAYRPWAARLASPLLRPLVREFFRMLSRHRGRLSTWWAMADEREIRARLAPSARACGDRCAPPGDERELALREMLEHP